MLTILVVFKFFFISDMSLCKISDDLGGVILVFLPQSYNVNNLGSF